MSYSHARIVFSSAKVLFLVRSYFTESSGSYQIMWRIPPLNDSPLIDTSLFFSQNHLKESIIITTKRATFLRITSFHPYTFSAHSKIEQRLSLSGPKIY
jgi:hypothetical protein